MFKKKMVLALALSVCLMAACSSGGTAPSGSGGAPAGTEASASASAPASGSKFPARQIEIIVPYAAGGGVDINCRAIAPFLEENLGVPVVVINKPGAGGVPGMTYGAMVNPDGYTLTIANIIAMCANSALGDFTLDPRSDFQFLGVTVMDPGVIAVSKDSPYNTLDEVITYLKSNPDGLSYGATGDLSLDGLLCINLEKLADVEINTVNFDGGKDALAALMGGHIQLMGGTLSEIITPYQDGEVKILGVGGAERLAELPEVPTFAEQGYDMSITAAKRALMMPPGADPEVVKILTDAVEKAVTSEGFIAKCKELGLRSTYLNPDECVAEANTVMSFFDENF